jgi:hypothetical protein
MKALIAAMGLLATTISASALELEGYVKQLTGSPPPYMVLVLPWGCNGIILNDRTIATVAHCLYDDNKSKLVDDISVLYRDKNGVVRKGHVKTAVIPPIYVDTPAILRSPLSGVCLSSESKRLYDLRPPEYIEGCGCANPGAGKCWPLHDFALLLVDKLDTSVSPPTIYSLLDERIYKALARSDGSWSKEVDSLVTPALTSKLRLVTPASDYPRPQALIVTVGTHSCPKGHVWGTKISEEELDQIIKCFREDTFRWVQLLLVYGRGCQPGEWVSWCTGVPSPIQHGDSGSPIFLAGSDGVWYLAGLVSTSINFHPTGGGQVYMGWKEIPRGIMYTSFIFEMKFYFDYLGRYIVGK